MPALAQELIEVISLQSQWSCSYFSIFRSFGSCSDFHIVIEPIIVLIGSPKFVKVFSVLKAFMLNYHTSFKSRWL